MRTSRTRGFAFVLAASTLAPLPAAAPPFQIGQLDHFTIYITGGQTDPPPVTLQDQFQIVTGDPDEVFPNLLVPADKNGEGIIDPSSHLYCYETGFATTKVLPPVVLTHQFGSTTFPASSARVVCVPTEKFPPAQVSIDHYLCYRPGTLGSPLGVNATFTDQFYSQAHDLGSAWMFCAPAVKNGEAPIDDPWNHLVCFQFDQPGPGVNEIPIRNQFGSEVVDLLQRWGVCLPARKEVPPPGILDHFLYYDATGPDGPPVSVEDQFGLQPAGLDLGPVVSFLVPASKNNEPIIDPPSHLTGYDMPGPPPPASFQRVRVTHQFGARTLQLGPARQLLVPTQKQIGQPPPISIDHFACYEANGGSLDQPVSLLDQFHPAALVRTLREPFLFCNPASKNQEGVFNVEDHLTCYRSEPAGTPVGSVTITNQFTPPIQPTQIDVQADVALCLPSKKEILEFEIPALPAWALAALGAALFATTALLARRRRAAA